MTSQKQEESKLVVDTGQSPRVQCSSGINAIFLQILRTKSWYQCYSYLFQFPEDGRWEEVFSKGSHSSHFWRPNHADPTGTNNWVKGVDRCRHQARQNFLRHTWLYNLEPLQEKRPKVRRSRCFHSDIQMMSLKFGELFWLEWRGCQNLLGGGGGGVFVVLLFGQ